ncbi:MAG: hypothetical protein FJ087_16810 [Deltaproteobacteria bacterium]|nr:hypothetical protein [Deltaproteobacteria bacterium]
MGRRIALGVVATLLACGPDFDKLSEVKGPRVLGIVADRPAIAFDGQAALEAVIAYPDQVASIAWTWCALNLGSAGAYACAVPEIPMPETGPTAAFDAAALQPFLAGLKPALPDLVEFLKQTVTQDDECTRAMLDDWDACGGEEAACLDAGYDALVACLHSEGMEVTLHLRVDWKDGGGVDAYKRLLLRDPAPDRRPNANPALDGVVVAGTLVKSGGEARSLPGGKLDMAASPAPGAVEQYEGPDGVRDERVFFTWYSDSGEFAHIRSTPEAPDNRLSLPAERPDEVRVWVFAHDDRGGASYVAFRVLNRDAP